MNRIFSGTITLLLLAFMFSAFSQEKTGENSSGAVSDSTIGNIRDSLSTNGADTAVKTISGDQLPDSNSAARVGADSSSMVQGSLSDSDQQAGDLKTDSSIGVISVPVTTVLQISSVPAGAAVILNDSVLGVTPITVSSVVPGKHNLVFKMKGYYQKRTEILVSIKDTQQIKIELLKPAVVTYLSKPEGVAVSVNGKNRGTAPFIDSLVKPGNYLIKGTLDGYEVATKNVTIANGAVDTVTLEMLKPGEKRKETPEISVDAGRSVKKYSGIIGAAAFALFAFVLLLAERDNL